MRKLLIALLVSTFFVTTIGVTVADWSPDSNIIFITRPSNLGNGSVLVETLVATDVYCKFEYRDGSDQNFTEVYVFYLYGYSVDMSDVEVLVSNDTFAKRAGDPGNQTHVEDERYENVTVPEGTYFVAMVRILEMFWNNESKSIGLGDQDTVKIFVEWMPAEEPTPPETPNYLWVGMLIWGVASAVGLVLVGQHYHKSPRKYMRSVK